MPPSCVAYHIEPSALIAESKVKDSSKENKLDTEEIASLLTRNRGRAKLIMTKKPHIMLKMNNGETVLQTLKRSL